MYRNECKKLNFINVLLNQIKMKKTKWKKNKIKNNNNKFELELNVWCNYCVNLWYISAMKVNPKPAITSLCGAMTKLSAIWLVDTKLESWLLLQPTESFYTPTAQA